METSTCKLNATIEIKEVKVEKIPEKNTLIFTLDISPVTNAYSEYDLKEIFEFDNPGMTITDAYYEDGELVFEVDYTDDLEGKDLTIKVKEDHAFEEGDPLDPNAEDIYESEKVPFSISSSFIPVKTDNNLDSYYYSDKVYEEAEKMKTAADVIGVLGLVFAGICLFIKNGFSTMLILTNLQSVFLSLVAIDGMHPVTKSLTNLKITLGANDPDIIADNEEPLDNRRVESLGFDGSFANNFNIMLFIQIGLLGGAGLIYLIAQKRNIMKTPFKVFQRESLILVFFNISNFLFSISLIRSSQFMNVCFAVAAGIIAIGQMAHFVINAKTYFGMPETFNFETVHFKTFIIGFCVGRVGIAFCLSLVDDPLMSCIGALAVQACLVVFICIIRPFSSHVVNGLFIASETMTLGAFVSIYVFEGLDGSESTGAWTLLGMAAGIVAIVIASLVFNIY